LKKTLKVGRFTVKVGRFTVKVGRFTVKVGRFTVLTLVSVGMELALSA